MKYLPIAYSVEDSLRGRILYVHGDVESISNAFDIREKSSIKILLPRTMGAVCVYAQLYNESLSSVVYETMLEWSGINGGLDSYIANLDTNAIGVGLYFYKIRIELPYTTLYAVREGDEIRFSHDEKSSFFQLTIFEKKYAAPERYMGGIIYHIFVDRFNRGGKTEKKDGAILVDDWSHGVAEYPAFAGAPLKNNTFYGGTLWGVIDKLDYIKSLGVNLI